MLNRESIVLSIIEPYGPTSLRLIHLVFGPILGASTPWGVAFSGNGKVLAVVHFVTDEVSLSDFPAVLGTDPTPSALPFLFERLPSVAAPSSRLRWMFIRFRDVWFPAILKG